MMEIDPQNEREELEEPKKKGSRAAANQGLGNQPRQFFPEDPSFQGLEEAIQRSEVIGTQGHLQNLVSQSDHLKKETLLNKSVADKNTDRAPAQLQEVKSLALNETGLPDKLKYGVEQLSGYSMSDVKVHYNSAKPAEVGAHAYAQGTQIHVASGQEKHLPHEAWHVVQQKQGRVKPTIKLAKGIVINDEEGLEREADLMGQRALSSESSSRHFKEKDKMGGIINSPIQRVITRSMHTLMRDDVNVFINVLRRAKIGERTKKEIIDEWVKSKGQSMNIFQELSEYHASLDEESHIAQSDAQLNDLVELAMNDEGHGYGVTEDFEEDEVYLDFVENPYPHQEDGLDVHPDQIPMDGASDGGPDEEPPDDGVAPMQEKRTGGAMTGPKNVKPKQHALWGGDFTNSFYILGSEGELDFDVRLSQGDYDSHRNNIDNSLPAVDVRVPPNNWRDPHYGNNKNDSLVDLRTHPRAAEIDVSKRSQHFGMADRLLSDKLYGKDVLPAKVVKDVIRKGKWTWHHLIGEYEMVLVDMEVHAQHGHNGGVFIWNNP